MKGCNSAYLQAIIDALMAANRNLMNASVNEALALTSYGKGDTKGLDAIPEIQIVRHMKKFDPEAITVTEELGCGIAGTWRNFSHDPSRQPIIFFCDPTDRSSELCKFLEHYMEDEGSVKIGELIKRPEALEYWKVIAGEPIEITGATAGVTCLKHGRVIFSVVFNYITQQFFLACSDGTFYYSLMAPSDQMYTVTPEIIKGGEKLIFPYIAWTPDHSFVTFMGSAGKEGYPENFRDSMQFAKGDHQRCHYNKPGGPSRILYLSHIQTQLETVDCILANGEKIGEWIHWLPYMRFAKDGDTPSLVLFEISHERPWTKNGILMSTSRNYSIFQDDEDGDVLIDVSQLARFENPSLFRSTLLIAHEDNEWVIHTMSQKGYRQIAMPS